MRTNLRNFTLVMGLLLLTASTSLAQSPNRIYAGFIYHFTKYTQWPSEMNTGDFVIGVIGSKEMEQELEGLAQSKTVSGRKIVVKEFSKSTIGKCHILFVAKENSGSLKTISAEAAKNNTLVVSESDGATASGSIINFVRSSDKVRFELHMANAAKHALKISSDLQKLAIIVG